jgi:hypothetical protein
MRGLQDIRTLSGKVDQAFIPYKGYMKVSCLEMEKLRRGKERESAMQRVKNIDARFREIEAEKAALLQTLKERDCRNSDNAPGIQPKPTLRRSTGGFKFRY